MRNIYDNNNYGITRHLHWQQPQSIKCKYICSNKGGIQEVSPNLPHKTLHGLMKKERGKIRSSISVQITPNP